MRHALLFAAATVALAGPASAHWQYTRWGMSPEEVQAANPALRAGEDRHHSFAGSLVRLSGTYREGGRDFVVRFGFNGENRLNTVYVQPAVPRDCRRMVAAVEARLGRGTPRSQIRNILDIRVWQDSAAGNQLQLIAIGNMRAPQSCTIRYHPPEGPGEPDPPAGKPGSDI
ncbi:MAG TPA: hypothetical protein VF702_12660 [Allosphingosinicella sp.]|jgi:hypothetical protein